MLFYETTRVKGVQLLKISTLLLLRVLIFTVSCPDCTEALADYYYVSPSKIVTDCYYCKIDVRVKRFCKFVIRI